MRREVMNAREIKRALTRMSLEIMERNGDVSDLVVVGIITRGVSLAVRLSKLMAAEEGIEVKIGSLDITLYRDDLNLQGRDRIPPGELVSKTDIPFDVNDKVVILVDDILYTGRTTRAALGQLMDFGRPRSIQLAILVDRGHRELPIRPDYVGKNISTLREEKVKVQLTEVDEVDQDRVIVI
ncbi:MAG: bifunctional pyr operon transcriptional regulator/uracil phosphoribosyltransferase PyrR [bacterium]